MSMQDPIADMLTRIRNAIKAKNTSVEFNYSKIKEEITKTLLKEKYIKEYKIIPLSNNKDKKSSLKNIRVELKYLKNDKNIISNLRRISKPGLRVYVQKTEIPKVLNGIGIAILSTSKGIMTDNEARQQNVGGEVIAYV